MHNLKEKTKDGVNILWRNFNENEQVLDYYFDAENNIIVDRLKKLKIAHDSEDTDRNGNLTVDFKKMKQLCNSINNKRLAIEESKNILNRLATGESKSLPYVTADNDGMWLHEENPNYKPDNNQDPENITRLSDYKWVPIRRERDLSDDEYCLVVEFDNGLEMQTMKIPELHLADINSIRNKYNKSGLFNFFGNQNALMIFLSLYIKDCQIPTHAATKTQGFVEYKNKTLFVTPHACINADGEAVDDLFFNGHEDSTINNNLNCMDTNSSSEQRVSELIFDFNDPVICGQLMGWNAACMYKHKITQIEQQFPVLHLIGPAESGKSRSFDIVKSMWGDKSTSLTPFYNTTPFVRRKLLSSTNAFPVIFDEVKPHNNFMINTWSEEVNTIYNSLEAQRGNVDQTINRYPYTAPVAAIGEFKVGDASNYDRTLFVDYDPNVSILHKDKWEELRKYDLSYIGNRLARDSMQDEDITEMLLSIQNKIASETNLTARNLWNVTCCMFGLTKLCSVLNIEPANICNTILHHYKNIDHAENRTSLPKVVVENFVSMMEYHYEDNHDSKIYTWNKHLIEGQHYKRMGDNGHVAFSIAAIWDIYTAWAKESDSQCRIRKKADFIQQIQSEKSIFIEKNAAVKIGGKTKRCLILNLEDIE